MVFLPTGALTIAVFRMTGATEFLQAVFNDPGYLETLPRDIFLDLARPFIVAATVALLLQGIATLFVYLACHRMAMDDIRGQTVDPRASRRHAVRSLGRAVVAGLIAAVVVLGLLALGILTWTLPMASVGTPNSVSLAIAGALFAVLVTPAVWLAISLSMMTPVVSLEDRGVVGSLTRSRRLVRGRWWPTLGFLLLVGLLGSVATQLIQLVAIPLATVGGVGLGMVLVSLLGLAAQGPIVAAMGATYTHWYLDLRARVEPVLEDQL
jgi:hypothetical protein